MLSDFEDWENIIHFGNYFGSIGKKTYFLALGTTPVKGVCFIEGKITGTRTNLRNNVIFFYIKDCLSFSPPKPHQDAYQFDFGRDMQHNLAMIGAIPHSGIEQVRIHWLLDLITVSR